MITVYVTSLQEGAGKTALCAGLGKNLLSQGKKVGFLKPVMGSQPADGDAAFLKRLLALSEPLEDICPPVNKENLADGVKLSASRVSQGKDVLIIEGVPLLTSYNIVEALGAKVLVVHDYNSPLVSAVADYQKFGGRLLGVVLNKVPKKKLSSVQGQVSAELAQAGLSLLGAIREDRVLMSSTVAELAGQVQGKIVSNVDKSAELAESFMLGAMTFDHGPDYFGRKSNKAVIVRAERPDMQMAALETSTRCLVLSGGGMPLPIVLRQAEAKKVPIIVAGGDIKTLVNAIEGAFKQARFTQEKKLPRLAELLEQGFNYKVAYPALGLAA